MTYINKLENMIKNLPNTYPNIDEDINYIWNTLPEIMDNFSYEELINNQYEINKLSIIYLMELLIIYKNININYDIDEITSLAAAAAYDKNNNKIILSVIGMMLKSVNTMSYIQTIFHELRHVYQNQFYNEEKIDELIKYDPKMIMILKHYIYEKYHQENNREFYINNYKKLYPEVDAEIQSLKDIEELINNLIKDNNLKNQLKDDLDEIKENIDVYPQSNKELNTNNEINTILEINGNKEDSLILIDDFISKNSILINEYKALKILFDGYTLKTYKKIIEDKEKLLEKYKNTEYYDNICQLYQNIIRSNPIYQIEEYTHNNLIEEKANFLKNHPTITENYNKILKKYKNDAT